MPCNSVLGHLPSALLPLEGLLAKAPQLWLLKTSALNLYLIPRASPCLSE